MNNTSIHQNDYREQVIEDLKTWAEEGNAEGVKDIEELRERLQDPSLTDGITGNASGSYYCNAYKAQEQIDKSGILWDEDFLGWLDSLGLELADFMKRGAESVDVLAREYALEALSDREIAEACGFDLGA